MGILDFFKRKEKVPPKEIGNIEPICPYCNKPLAKMPAKKKKCPECGNFRFQPLGCRAVEESCRLDSSFACQSDIQSLIDFFRLKPYESLERSPCQAHQS